MSKGSRWGSGTRFTNSDKGKEILLRVAIECMVKRGVTRTTVDNIAAMADVSRRTVYRYFADKHQILEEAFAYRLNLVFAELRERAAPYANDFPRYFEECVVGAMRFYGSLWDDSNTVAETANHSEEDMRNSWRKLLRPPYNRFLEESDEPASERTLEEFVDLAHILVVAHCHMHSSEEQVRTSIRNLRIKPLKNRKN